jgi:phosphotransferase system enzyme I (PtsI)
MDNVVQGIGVSAGSAYAPVVQVGAAVRPPQDEQVLSLEDASPRIEAAFEEVAVEIERRVALASDNAAEILGATAMLARDPGLLAAAIEHVGAGRAPAAAVDAAIQDYIDRFIELGGYFAERATDLRDVGDRAMQLRVLATAADASKAWNLRCEIREKLLAFIQEQLPQSLPKMRASLNQIPQSPPA